LIDIRPFEVRDQEAILACIVGLQEYERRLDPYTLPGETIAVPYFHELLENCREKRGLIYVADSNGQIVGFISMMVEQSHDTLTSIREYLYISDIYVVESHRGQGIGTMLLNKAEDYARQVGCSVIQMYSLAKNDAALGVYHKFGFQDREILLSKELRPIPHSANDEGLIE
jgi:GNAT superfamily N-acetyltransferase